MSDALRELAVLSRQAADAEAQIERDEQALKASKAKLRRITEEDIPGLMSELGVAEIKLESGEKVTVGMEVYAAITEANKAAAFAWLEDNGYGGLIATDVMVAFPREEKDKVVPFMDALREQGHDPVAKMGIHASRLKAFLKERIQAGTAIPLDLFGAMPVNTAKIKRPKAAS